MALHHWAWVDFDQWPVRMVARDQQTLRRLYARYGIAGILRLLQDVIEDEQDAWLLGHWLEDTDEVSH